MYLTPHLYDLDDLVSTCKDFDSRSYINEAVSCYKHGLYRACIVNTWIALVFDLTKKIHELAESDVSEAIQYRNKFNNAQNELHTKREPKQVQSFEKEVLEAAQKLQLIDAYQYEDLKRLYEDRNRCAHPSFNLEREPYLPSAEQSRLHLRNVIEHVISRKPIQGQLAMDLFYRYVNSEMFPSEYNKVKSQFQLHGFDKIPKKTLKNIIDDIFFNKIKPQSELFLASNFHNFITSVKVLLELRRDDIYERVNSSVKKILKVSTGKETYASYIIALSFNDLIDFSHDENELFKDEIENIISKDINILYRDLYILCSQNPTFKMRVIDKINKLEIGELYDISNILSSSQSFSDQEITSKIIEKAISLYKVQKSYDYSNRVSGLLNSLAKHLSKQNISDIINIIEDKKNDQVRGSFVTQELIVSLYNQDLLTLDIISNSDFIKHKLQVYGINQS